MKHTTNLTIAAKHDALKNRKLHHLAVPLLTLLLAFLLRVPTLDWQSFWVDEAQSAHFVQRPLIETIKLVISPEHNGPLYYLLLWFWQWLTGPSDFAMRYLSTLCSVLTVAALWRLGATLYHRRVAGFAALLLAIAPFAIWYAQETRTYALHMLLATLSTLFLVKAIRYNRWPLWLSYGVSLNLLAYSHFFGAFAVAAQGIVTVCVTLKQWPRLRSYLATMLIVALFYLPIIRFVLRNLPGFQLQDISKGFVPLHFMLYEYGAEYTLRLSRLYVVRPWPLLAPLTAFLLLGLGHAWREHRRAALWVTGMLLLPTLIFYPISFKIPTFSAKYLSATFPFFILTLALSLDGLRRWWKPLAWAGLAIMVTTAAWANVRLLTEPELQRSNWRAAAGYLETQGVPGDVIVGFAHYATERMLLRYYDGPLPVLRFKHKPYEPEAYYLNLRDEGYHTLWLVLHQDQAMAPQNRLQAAAGALFPNVTGVYPNNGNIAILGYSLHWRHTALPEGGAPVEIRFSNGLALVGYHVDTTALSPTDKLLHPPSNWLHVTTYWQRTVPAAAAPAPDFTVYVRLVDTDGSVWGGELQRPPTVFHFDPPANWEAGDIIEAHYDVNLNPITPPGVYRLIAGIENDAIIASLRDIEITK
ncbi:MAG TPA: glycosyltransferase family 39 protein [Anaerolineae bacterium]|nr:glycosyltransferase family 39 protein [Anaerolineae bacterium]